MAPLVAKSSSNSVGTKKKTLGRRKVEMKKVEAPQQRHVTFSKRKKGLFQKADQLSSLTGSDIAVVVVSEGGRVFGFGTPSCDAVTDRYLARLSPNQNGNAQNHGIISCSDDIESMIVESIPSTSCSNYSQNGNADYQNGNDVVETTPLSSSCFESRVLERDKYLHLMNDTVSPLEPCEYQEGTNGSEAEEMSGEMIEEMIGEMMNEKEEEVPGCNEFLSNLARVLLPTTTWSYYTSLLVTEDKDDLIMDNRGLGNSYFNPYEDWRCGGICH